MLLKSVSALQAMCTALNICNEIEGSYDEIIITIVPSYTEKKNHLFVAVGIVTHAGRQMTTNL